MARKPYTVENQRPRRTVTLYGSVLAPKGVGRTSCMDLDAEELAGLPCARLLDAGRLKVIRGEVPVVQPVIASTEVELQEPLAPVVEADPVEHPTLEDVGDASPEVVPESEEAVELVEEPAAAPHAWTSAELKAMNAAEQKEICKSLGLPTGGKEDERIARILEAIDAAGAE